MSIRFLQPGLQTTLQDLGRVGYRRYGIAASGALDKLSLQLANWLVSKPLDAAALEITLSGPTLEFTHEMAIAITGAHFELFLNDQEIEMHRTLLVKAGDQLRFGKLLSGTRAYVAFSAKLALAPVMNSYATNLLAGFGGFAGRAFNRHDLLPLKDHVQPTERSSPKELRLQFGDNYRIRFVAGREWPQLDANNQTCFTGQPFAVTPQSNRMGLRLRGAAIHCHEKVSLTTVPITAGTIQLPPDGQPIITLADGQTSGGYPRIGQVIQADLNVLGQLKANDSISFQPVTAKEALSLLTQQSQKMVKLLKPIQPSAG